MVSNYTGQIRRLYTGTNVVLAPTNTACPCNVSPGGSGLEVTPSFPSIDRIRGTSLILAITVGCTTLRGLVGS